MSEHCEPTRTRRYSAPRPSVAQNFAESQRLTRGAAEQFLSEHRANGLWARLHAYVDACHRAGRPDLLWKKITALLERVNNRPAPVYGPKLLKDVAAAEAAESQVRQEMILDGQRDHHSELRALDRLAYTASALAESLRAERVCR